MRPTFRLSAMRVACMAVAIIAPLFDNAAATSPIVFASTNGDVLNVLRFDRIYRSGHGVFEYRSIEAPSTAFIARSNDT